MSEAIFDTSILVDHLRGFEKAFNLIEKVRKGSIIGYVSMLTVAELFAGKQLDDEKSIMLEDLLNLFNKINVDEQIAKSAGRFRRTYDVELADAIIGATASNLNCKVLTANFKDFEKIKEIQVERPY